MPRIPLAIIAAGSLFDPAHATVLSLDIVVPTFTVVSFYTEAISAGLRLTTMRVILTCVTSVVYAVGSLRRRACTTITVRTVVVSTIDPGTDFFAVIGFLCYFYPKGVQKGSFRLIFHETLFGSETVSGSTSECGIGGSLLSEGQTITFSYESRECGGKVDTLDSELRFLFEDGKGRFYTGYSSGDNGSQ